MIQIFISLIGILAKILAWGSLLYMAWILISKLRKKRSKKNLRFREWIAFSFAIGYIVTFILLRIFLPELFESLFCIAFLLILVISTQWTKYEDRKSGRRWWEQ